MCGASARSYGGLQAALSLAEEGFPQVHEVAANPLAWKLEGADERVLTLGGAKTVAIDPSPICDDFQVLQLWKASQMGSSG